MLSVFYKCTSINMNIKFDF